MTTVESDNQVYFVIFKQQQTPEIDVVIFNFKFQPPPSPKKWPGTTSSRPPSHAAIRCRVGLQKVRCISHVCQVNRNFLEFIFFYSLLLLWQNIHGDRHIVFQLKNQKEKINILFHGKSRFENDMKISKIPPSLFKNGKRRHKREKGK